jgi:PAS domain S-box-containing protein
MYIGSKLAIGAAFFVIAMALVQFLRKKPHLRIPPVYFLFGAFILFNGITSIMDAILFLWPAYRLNAFSQLVLAVLSWITVVAIFKYMPVALRLRTSKEFEEEIIRHTKSELKFMGLLESAPDAKVITDGDGKILMVNAQTERLFDFPRKEIIGKNVEILIPERYYEKHVAHRQGYIEDPQVRAWGIGMDLFARRKDKSEFPVEISLSPLKLPDEEGIMIISSIRNITRRKEIEAEINKLNSNLEQLVVERTAELELSLANEKAAREEMNQNHRRLAFLTEATNILASSIDYSETLVNLSKMITPEIADWCSIDEVDEEGVLNRTVVSHIDPEKVKFAYELVHKYPPDINDPRGIYEVVRTHQSELHHQITNENIESAARNQEHLDLLHQLGPKSAILVPLLSRDKIYGVLTLVMSESGRLFDEKDLDFAVELARRTTLAIENARLYKEMQDTNTELEHRVEKRTTELEAINKELEAFSYSVSHDLRAPLRSIDGFSNKILKEYNELFDDQGKDYFMRVMKASRHMGHLIDDLLKLARFSRIEMHMEEINLSTIAEAIVTELKESNPERKANIKIQDNMIAFGDKNLIQIALQNLLNNAWKYSKNQPDTHIEFGTSRKDGQITYFISDNGVGFDMHYVDKLFGAFQRLHSQSEFEGIGIGLATVQRIIRRHQGNIWAESVVNEGTTFFFTL